MKALFTVKPKDRNDLSGTMELEKHVYDIKRIMMGSLGSEGYVLETSFDQASVLYPKRFMFDYDSGDKACHSPKDVIGAFFDAIERTGTCISKYDVHVTITWP
ncbi:hypothetical protein [Methanocella conradii]|uniref:hypothetical protein n=1 Tax=Methanocella conradii TaxID=1175444 RepID=UPI0024B32D67|nr:hypothetical protein [Methanocella conradii]MDI6895888.1 hypothetical protein [Methanocella conradii]